MKLRSYQSDAVSAVYAQWSKEQTGALVVIPTGGGKTPIIATVTKDLVESGERVLILAHVKELICQSIEKIQAIAPGLSVGVFSAGLGSKDTEHDVIVAGIQSVWNQGAFLGRRDAVIIDEAHRIPEEESSRYKIILSELKLHNPDLNILGLTATPYRMDAGAIHGEDQIFPRISYEIGVKDLMDQGYLSRVKNKTGAENALPDLKGVHTRAGDFVQEELAERVDRIDLVHALVADLLAKAAGRKSILIFAVTVSHAVKIWQRLFELGEVAALVTGETASPERSLMVEQFKKKQTRFLVNVMVLTEGFDAPGIDCVVLGRPTQSPGLYYQMVGRGFRLAPEKTDCLILDYGRNISTHGPVNAISIARKKRAQGGPDREKEEKQTTKACPECSEMVPLESRECPDCQYAWPEIERTMPDPRPDQESQLIADGPSMPRWRKVVDVEYRAHSKKDAKPNDPRTLRVIYYYGLTEKISMYVCVEHSGYARAKAIQWWKENCALPFLENAEEAAALGNAGFFAEPLEVSVLEIPGQKWPELRKVSVDGKLMCVKTGKIPIGEAPMALEPIGEDDLPF